MKILICFLVVFSFFGCMKPASSKKVKVVNEVRKKAANKLKKEMDLIPMGVGGQMMDQIRMLKLVFQYRHPVNLEEGRKILLHAANEFLNQINSSKAILPYLQKQPFDSKDVIVVILVTALDGSRVEPGSLCMLVAEDGLLEYEVHDPDSNDLTTIYKETYEEALEILRQQERGNEVTKPFEVETLMDKQQNLGTYLHNTTQASSLALREISTKKQSKRKSSLMVRKGYYSKYAIGQS